MQLAIFKERLYPSISFSAALALSGPMVLLAALPFGPELAIPLGLLVPSGLVAVVYLLSPVIEVSESKLIAGRISVPLAALGEVVQLTKEEFGAALGPMANPAAQLMIRGYIATGVKIAVVDPEDPTPYILISSRRPKDLAVALDANRA